VAFYLGFDASTQSLTAILIEVQGARRAIAATDTFRYDDELPEYGTRHGAIVGVEAGVVSSPPLMWADALDRMMARLSRAHPAELSRVAALAISAQQHGSVYLNAEAAGRLASLDPRVALARQMDDVFTRPLSPIWLDSSTGEACAAMASALGGGDVVARITGSRPYERFTGPQIRQWARRAPVAYADTVRIDLVSSFLTSLLVGAPAPLDPGDASGMNLWDLSARRWWPDALETAAPNLAAKLPRVTGASDVVGVVAPYWQRRYGVPPARVVVGTGDNPSSLIGTGLVTKGRVAISLGTSNTVFGLVRDAQASESADGHVFGAPTGGYMGLTCFSNGAIAREATRDRYGLSWEDFSSALRRTRPGNDGGLMLPWLLPEITPHVASAGIRREHLDENDAEANVRGVAEGQAMAMANHTAWMGVAINEIHATGGASANRDILQVIADVFGARVARLPVTNSACLGAALRARHADVIAQGGPDDWSDAVAGFVEPHPDDCVEPSSAAHAVYVELRPRYAAFEARESGGQSL